MARTPPQLELDNQLCFALYAASRAVVRSYGPLLNELGITYPQYLTMLVLWEAGESVSVGDIGVRLRLDSGTLTPLLKRLEELRLVTRTRDPRDERRVLVALTKKGAAMRSRAADIPAKIFSCYGMSIAEARALISDLKHLVDTIDPDGAERPAGTAARG